MVHNITIPNLGLTMEEAKIIEWKKREKDYVRKGEILLEIETDKSAIEIEAPDGGYLHITGTQDNTYPVAETIGWIAGTEEDYEKALQDRKQDSIGEKPDEEDKRGPVQMEDIKTKPPAEDRDNEVRIKISPIAKKISRDNSVDYSQIKGTGPGGRIVKKDVLDFISSAQAKGKQQEETKKDTGLAGIDTQFKKIKEIVPVKGIRKAVFDQMIRSVKETAQVSFAMEADAQNLFDLRSQMNEQQEEHISYNAIFIKILGDTLIKHPYINSSVIKNSIYMWETINIGLAVQTDNGLIVPVIKDVINKRISMIQKEVETLVEKAKNRKIMPDDTKGGTFTLTNLGAWDIQAFTPILNANEAGILGIGKITDKPVVVEGNIKIGKRVYLSLTVDHRIIDGAGAASFLRSVKTYIENPTMLL